MNDSERMVGEIRAILAAFDWEHDDLQYALEAVERIVTTGQPGPNPGPRTFHGLNGERVTGAPDEDGVDLRTSFPRMKLSPTTTRALAAHLLECARRGDDWMADAAADALELGAEPEPDDPGSFGTEASAVTGPDFGDTVTGIVADENDWTGAGPRILRPRRTVRGTVIGLYADAPAVAKIRTQDGTAFCVRVVSRTPGNPSQTRLRPA